MYDFLVSTLFAPSWQLIDHHLPLGNQKQWHDGICLSGIGRNFERTPLNIVTYEMKDGRYPNRWQAMDAAMLFAHQFGRLNHNYNPITAKPEDRYRVLPEDRYRFFGTEDREAFIKQVKKVRKDKLSAYYQIYFVYTPWVEQYCLAWNHVDGEYDFAATVKLSSLWIRKLPLPEWFFKKEQEND
jgi:hypothetical protein